ncbi:MAG TPA: carboxylesterase family protein [Thermaerobacter sp.]|nr:carboxylesterase family protein [Thermostaphylospora chromogena]
MTRAKADMAGGRRWRPLVCALAVVAGTTAFTGATTSGREIVRTQVGLVRGVDHGSHREFLGIPYAAPPVGELRWRLPQPPKSWSGVRDASRQGARCAQHASVTGTPATDTEDCLYLNVTVPDSASPRKPKAVMVWLHGGGFVEGSGGEYDARRLAIHGDVVVVTINYRLGIFGNFGLPGLDGSGAFGLADQQAALRWVRANIRAFGGDPDTVTVFGQSAGGQSVCAHLASPGAAGLFDRAIIQSAFCTEDLPANLLAPGLPAVSPWEKADMLAERGLRTAAEFGCTDPATVVSCMRGLPADRLMSVFGQFAGPAYGSSVLPRNPYQVLREGRIHRVPVLSGTTRDEATYIRALHDLADRPLTAATYRRYLREAFGANAKRVLAAYPVRRSEPPSRTWARVATDSALTCPTLERNRLFARHVPTYGYEFADRSAPPTLPPVGYPYGAYHSADALYLFDLRVGGPVRPLSPEQRRLAATMIDYWADFARTGTPDGGARPAWQRLRPRDPLPYTLSLAPGPGGIRPVDLAREHRCGLWSTVTI